MASAPEASAERYPGGWSSTSLVRMLSRGQGRPAAAVIVLLMAVCHVWLGERYWSPVRHAIFDVYQRVFPRQVHQLPVVIVDIDDASLAAVGQWPWPRTRLAQLLEAVSQLGVLAVGLDMIMPEADRLSPGVFLVDRPDLPAVLRDELARLPSNDAILAETLRRVPSVVGRAGVSTRAHGATPAPGHTPVRVHGDTPLGPVPAYAGQVTNVLPIEEAALGHGYLNAIPDRDGVVRAVPLLVEVDGALAPTFALELLRVAVGAPMYSVYGGPHGVRGVQIGTSFMPTDPDGRIRLYYSPPDPRRRVSALAILNGAVQANVLADHIAIVGVTGVGLTDVVATPVTALMDGVEVQAQVIENIVHGTRLIRSFVVLWLEVGLFLSYAAVLIVWVPRRNPGAGVAVFLLATALLAASSLLSFVYARVLLDASFPAVGNIITLGVLLTAAFAAMDRNRREIKAALEAERLAKVHMAGELRAARDIQMGILPAPGAIVGLPDSLVFHALLEPAAEVGGDLYDVFMLDGDRLFFVIGDVAGKGVPASLFMALSKTLCKYAALREQVPLAALMTLINEAIARDNPASLFVTALAGIIDVRSGAMELCSAGHEAPILLRAGEAPCVLDTAGGPALCMLEDFSYDAGWVQLRPGDMLVMLTDGVTEAQNPAQHLYGLARVLEWLTDGQQPGTPWHSVEAICHGLYADVKRFASGAAASDDITIMAIAYTGPLPSLTGPLPGLIRPLPSTPVAPSR